VPLGSARQGRVRGALEEAARDLRGGYHAALGALAADLALRLQVLEGLKL